MWRLDLHGTPLDDADAAREELRRRAWLAIGDGLRCGYDVRHHRVRVRSEDGEIVFEGTLAEAVASDTRHLALPTAQREETLAETSQRIRHRAAMNRQALLDAGVRLSTTMASLKEEFRVAQQLVEASRAYTARS